MLELLLKNQEGSEQTPQDAEALVQSAQDHPQVVEAFRTLNRFLPPDVSDELADLLRFALIGICVGFAERSLSPFIEEHLEIIPPLLDDIRSVYDQLKSIGAEFDLDEFRLRAYDYGIHKAYYLDWRLYLSHEMY